MKFKHVAFYIEKMKNTLSNNSASNSVLLRNENDYQNYTSDYESDQIIKRDNIILWKNNKNV